ncbi:MAG: N-(5'-phosphoribosyl)anthranilate isomerase, partial [Rhodospirillaceae bacterium]|nr:N-(5'-phosphoribosyl)anthranilate isomerase [Rhodospirillaceae bacterium]
MTWIKICGLTRVADAEAAAGADAAGFVFYPPSPRAVSRDLAAAIAAALPAGIAKVGVFVNEAPSRMEAIADAVGLDLFQLHGDEAPAVAARLSRPVIRAVRNADEMAMVGNAIPLVDGARAGLYGGTGTAAAPAAIAAARIRTKWILSGGLDCVSAASRIAALAP